ncbi:MAG: HIT family protein [Pirellulales bacterium]
MKHTQLWAPWRLGYVQQDKSPIETPAPRVPLLPGADQECFICRYAAAGPCRENLVVWRGPQSITILNRYPYNNGHLLIAPLLHKSRLDQLSVEEQLETLGMLSKMIGLLERLLRAEGFNVGLNLGHVAGAGVPGHLHWHLVPRWTGDTNFMPVASGIKVIPQSLDALWELLVEASNNQPTGG